MTFATGKKRPSEARRVGQARDGRRRHAGREGFTLLEVVLAAALVLVLASLAVIRLTGLTDSRRLEEGCLQFEAALRMARADSANLGKRLRLVCRADGRPTVLWEPDGLGRPGEFVEYSACTWTDRLGADLVRVNLCALVGPSAYRTLATGQIGAGASREAPLEEITFYPDGSSDSAVIELSSLSVADRRRAVVDLDGISGAVASRILAPEEFQEP